MPTFHRYIGIDYSGAETADSICKGLRVYVAEGSDTPKQIQPPPSPRRYWTRRGLAEWLCEELAADTPTLVGIDHGFSFPIESISRSIGLLTSLTPTSTSSGTATWETAESGWARTLGSALPNGGQRPRNPFSSLTFRARSPSPRSPDCLGCST